MKYEIGDIAENVTVPLIEYKCSWCRCIADEETCCRAFNGDDYKECMWKR